MPTTQKLNDPAPQEPINTIGEITRKTIIGDVIRSYPFAVEIFMDYGIHCVGCHVSDFETLEQGILGHGFSEGELLDIINELNEMVKNPPEEDEFGDLPV